MDLLERIQQEIKGRVAELPPLAVEYKRLREAYAVLSNAEGRTPVQRPSATATRSAAATRAPRGSARELILAAATHDPDAKRGDIAKATGLSPNTVGTTLSKLRAEGLLPRPARSHSARSPGDHTAASDDDATESQQAAELLGTQGVGEAPMAENGTHHTADVGSEGTTGVDETAAKPSARRQRTRRATKATTE